MAGPDAACHARADPCKPPPARKHHERTRVITLTINGRAVQARAGQTVYEAAAAAGIRIPVLCHHPRLQPQGACRICLVEIEKQRGLQPSCTYPVTEGMVVRTDTPAVIASRKASLHLIFSERTHYCMFCPASGSGETTDCELQKLGYEHGLDCWSYAPNYRQAMAGGRLAEIFRDGPWPLHSLPPLPPRVR